MKLIKKLLRESLLKEYEVFEPKTKQRFSFDIPVANNVMRFELTKPINYEGYYCFALDFGPLVPVPKNRLKSGIADYFTSIMYTMDKHISEIIQRERIRYIRFEGQHDDKADKNLGPEDNNLRERYYLRFIKNNFPTGLDCVVKFDGNYVVDMAPRFSHINNWVESDETLNVFGGDDQMDRERMEFHKFIGALGDKYPFLEINANGQDDYEVWNNTSNKSFGAIGLDEDGFYFFPGDYSEVSVITLNDLRREVLSRLS